MGQENHCVEPYLKELCDVLGFKTVRFVEILSGLGDENDTELLSNANESYELDIIECIK